MKHRLNKQARRIAGRPANRIALASAGTLAAAVLTGVMLSQSPAPVVSGGTANVAAAELARSTGEQVGAPIATPGTGSDTPARSTPAQTTPAQPSTPAKTEPPAPPAAKTLDYDYQIQTTYYYCGPAATRIALSASGVRLSQDELAALLNTDEGGTDSAVDTTRVLNSVGKTNVYSTREIPGGEATPAQMDRLQADAVHAISNGHAIVANIAGTQLDTDGAAHSYDGGHYLTVVGYKDSGRTLKIADPAFVNGQSSYWMTTINFANWMATRGYSA